MFWLDEVRAFYQNQKDMFPLVEGLKDWEDLGPDLQAKWAETYDEMIAKQRLDTDKDSL